MATIFFIPHKAFAADEFSTSYDVTYDVGSDGVTNVTQKITLKNLTSQYYASNFTLSIGSASIFDVSASDEAGVMEVKTEAKDNKTAIAVQFNQQVAGIGKSQSFTLRFKSKDFAQSIGKTWEVNLPKIPTSGSVDNYNLILSVPVGFGDPTSISPSPSSESQTFDRLFFAFNKRSLISSGVSVNFGTTQVFDFNLKYNLENNSLFPVITSITLPPDTDYQDVVISRINPAPSNVTIDEDGNYLAWYKLPRRNKLDVTVVGSAKLYINQKYGLKAPKLTLTDKQIQAWTKNDKFWEKSSPAITAALGEIWKYGTPKTNKEKAQLIFQYVVNNLKYDTDRLNSDNVERLGAATVLNNPNSAVCMEFTDLFIALSRASGIPTRELDGFAYTQNKTLRPLSLTKNLLHAWPEYFDEQKGWTMVDPTWENTSGMDYFNKFDLNHLVLATRGVSSEGPSTSNDVKVVVAEADFQGKPQISIDLNIPDTVWAGLPISLPIKILNQGNAVEGATNLSIKSGKITILGSNQVGLGSIPPFGAASYQFNLRTPFLWHGFDDTLEVEVAGQKFTKKVTVKPLFMFAPVPYMVGALILLVLAIYGTTLGFHIYQKRKLSKRK